MDIVKTPRVAISLNISSIQQKLIIWSEQCSVFNTLTQAKTTSYDLVSLHFGDANKLARFICWEQKATLQLINNVSKTHKLGSVTKSWHRQLTKELLFYSEPAVGIPCGITSEWEETLSVKQLMKISSTSKNLLSLLLEKKIKQIKN